MGQEFRYRCTVEIWRLLWIIAVMVALVLTLQHLELPYGNIISSLSSSHKDLGMGNNEMVGNVTGLNGLNSTNGSPETDNNYGRETSADVNYGFASGGAGGLNSSSAIENHGKESSLEHLVDTNTNSTTDLNNNAVSEDSGSLSESSGIDSNGKESSSEQLVHTNKNNGLHNGSAPEEIERSYSIINSTSENTEALDAEISPIAPALPPIDPPPSIILPRNTESNIMIPVVPAESNMSAADKNATSSLASEGKSMEQQHNLTVFRDDSSVISVHKVKEEPEMPSPAVISISEMNKLQLQGRSSSNLMRPRWSSAVDQELINAKSQIENAPIVENDPMLYAPLYRNVSMFKRSYELMEDILKVYIYKEGERPVLHQPILKGIYASEGWFMKLLEANKKFVTKHPKKAHLFYLPFSSRNLEEHLYVPNSHSHKNLVQYLKNYLDMISARYPYWNRTQGADHFLVACHDWAPSETKKLMANCIRALCNSDAKEGFVFGKDVSLPETYVLTPQNLLRGLGGKPPSKRSILAFFAGSMHGYLRPILLQNWENKDPDMKIFGRLPKVKGKMNYIQYMKSSKYCICAKGYEVNSPRVVEAIFYECVPVIISDNFVPPFFEVLNWESFAVFILEKDIPNLKNILLSIPDRRYRSMQMRVKKVQQHFLWHSRPVKYDIFHMILHSVWYNRVFQMQSR